uniref:Uncharacterized protein n=1 Tax=Trichuris muris TaxID=70415 RepID=A0A5S6Q8Q5_TRIMR
MAVWSREKQQCEGVLEWTPLEQSARLPLLLLSGAIVAVSFLTGRAIYLLHSKTAVASKQFAGFPTLQRLVSWTSKVAMLQLCLLRAGTDMCWKKLNPNFNSTEEEKLILTSQNSPLEHSPDHSKLQRQPSSDPQMIIAIENLNNLYENNGDLSADVDLIRVASADCLDMGYLPVGQLGKAESVDETPFQSPPSSIGISVHSDQYSVHSTDIEFYACVDDFYEVTP